MTEAEVQEIQGWPKLCDTLKASRKSLKDGTEDIPFTLLETAHHRDQLKTVSEGALGARVVTLMNLLQSYDVNTIKDHMAEQGVKDLMTQLCNFMSDSSFVVKLWLTQLCATINEARTNWEDFIVDGNFKAENSLLDLATDTKAKGFNATLMEPCIKASTALSFYQVFNFTQLAQGRLPPHPGISLYGSQLSCQVFLFTSPFDGH